jgi:hypothetical protein
MRRDRQAAYAALTPGLVRTYLLAPENDLVILDIGRRGDLDAMVTIATGRNRSADADRPAPLTSYAIVPLPPTATENLDTLCELALVLGTVAGAVTAEDSFGKAQSFALSVIDGSGDAIAEGRTTPERVKERLAHYFHPNEMHRKIPGPEWGLFLSEGHLKVVPVERLRASGLFVEVREIARGLVLTLLTPDPADALRPIFEQKLRAAREVLAPMLMDWSRVPDGVLR